MNSSVLEKKSSARLTPDTADEIRRRDVVVIGAGFSGLISAAGLKRAGIEDFVIIERSNEVGGTWRDNSYPGAACDVPSHLYSLSHRQDFEWSRSFATQPEIHRYQLSVAVADGVYPHIEFCTEMTDAKWNDTENMWEISTREVQVNPDGSVTAVAGGTTILWQAEELILGVGALCEPRMPDIQGINDFQGEVFHSARWNHDVSLAGKRVAVIGTGASAIQIVPSIAGLAGHIDLYQRTPPYVIPRFDRPYTGLERTLLRRVPGLRRIVRAQDWFFRELQVPGLITSAKWSLEPVRLLSLAMLRAQVRDPKTRRALTPDYRLGCKRMLISNKYYKAIDRDDVELVTSGISEIREHSIVTNDGTEREIDVLIVCTGFNVVDSPTLELIHNSDDTELAEMWNREGMEAYKGTTVHSFPNMNVLFGPATGLGHSSMLIMIEGQVKYLTDKLKWRHKRKLAVADVSREAQEKYNKALREQLPHTTWLDGCSSWYLDDQGNAPAVWPHSTVYFRHLTKKFDPDAYDVRAAR
ncbi:NAD(P)/FAD-dependent oxidoreductase [Corynebacterium sp. TAE3-ERU12]|uniref:flavin-containing monooxygenase n=1 Tax=Corynebacterium sp. TAE3-ERU12 TaxID=2849491 RepID=UPI001C440560|nr:NAD(P)/FAD-dependent oxidoreductase [Corynebacterium sp. TAE3-ERU12]MBV7295793.1 NAD(P)/FAD-dependent oxidoreductase [Corynebacterium sp. TAE3-ERU12]